MAIVCIYLPPRRGGDAHKEGWDMQRTGVDRRDKLAAALEIFRQLSPEQQVEVTALAAALAESQETFSSGAEVCAGV